MNPLVSLIDVVRSYRDGSVVGPLSFTLTSRTITAVVGPNGSGKTTLLRLAAGLITPSRGKATIAALPKALVLEKRHLYPQLTVDENLALFATLSGAEAVTRERVLERFSLTSFCAKLVGHLSRGEKQRVALARAFVQRSPLMFLDEPFSGLDAPTQAGLVVELRAAAAAGAAIIIASHRTQLLAECADQLIVLREGRVSYQGEWKNEAVT